MVYVELSVLLFSCSCGFAVFDVVPGISLSGDLYMLQLVLLSGVLLLNGDYIAQRIAVILVLLVVTNYYYSWYCAVSMLLSKK